MNATYCYRYQKVAGSRKEPGGVLHGLFKSAVEAREYHSATNGYVRRVKVPKPQR